MVKRRESRTGPTEQSPGYVPPVTPPDHPQLGPHRGARGQPRCERCALPPDLCLCADVRPLELATRVLVFLHRREVHKTTNTARMVPIALAHAEVRVVGEPQDRARFADIAPAGHRVLLLYPSPRSRPLTRGSGAQPTTLVVPDGNWRQAQKLAVNEPQLAELEHVHLPEGPATSYVLRSHPDPRYLATFEAIARALGILESEEVRRALERVLALKIERTLWTRSRPKAAELDASLARRRPLPDS